MKKTKIGYKKWLLGNTRHCLWKKKDFKKVEIDIRICAKKEIQKKVWEKIHTRKYLKKTNKKKKKYMKEYKKNRIQQGIF